MVEKVVYTMKEKDVECPPPTATYAPPHTHPNATSCLEQAEKKGKKV